MYTYIYTYTHIHIQIHTHTHIYIYIHTYKYIQIYICIYVYICIYIQVTTTKLCALLLTQPMMVLRACPAISLAARYIRSQRPRTLQTRIVREIQILFDSIVEILECV